LEFKTNDVYLWTNDGNMKKTKSKKIISVPEDKISIVSEPEVVYNFAKSSNGLKDFSYDDFKRIANKAPFSIAEWADILHVSERTLQRYAKNNTTFAPINAERITLVEKVLKEAKITFGKIENFYNWLTRNPNIPEGSLSLQSLQSYEGIQNVLTQLGRIQHGITA
jgi:uncharacterized protein (DUF2384 family)